MRYLVLRKPSADVNPLVEMISAGGGSHDFEFPLEREVIESAIRTPQTSQRSIGGRHRRIDTVHADTAAGS